MPMLRRFLGTRLLAGRLRKDCRRKNRRLIFFGRHAGYAGMVETLRCLGQRLAAMGHYTAFAKIMPAYEYQNLESAKAHLCDLGKDILRVGLPSGLRPLIIGFSGYGNVSRGAQEVLDCMKVREIPVTELRAEAGSGSAWGEIIKVIFREEHMVRRSDPKEPFDLQDYYEHPETTAAASKSICRTWTCSSMRSIGRSATHGW